jgi:putative transport protein
MDWLARTLIEHPEIAILLTVGLGFLVGRLHYKTLAVGAVTGSLIIGLVLGAVVTTTASDGTKQHIAIDPTVKNVFFLLFLFALGYKLGPQFVSGLKGSGLPQAVFAVILASVAFLTVIVLSMLLDYNPGLAAGMASGALTQSAIIGVAQGAIAGLPQDQATLQQWSQLVPVAYAVTYIFGTVGTALFVANIAPRMLGIKDLPAAAHDLERRLGFSDPNPDVQSGYADVVRRSYTLERIPEHARTVADFESFLDAHPGSAPGRVFVARARHEGQVTDVVGDTALVPGDTIALTAHGTDLFAAEVAPYVEEVDDRELLDFPIEDLWLVVTHPDVVGKSLRDLRARPRGRLLFLRGWRRSGLDLPWSQETVFDAGDEVHVQGPLPLMEAAIKDIGYPERNTPDANMVVIGLAIAIGALIGVPTVMVGDVPIGLSTSVGALLAGLLVGWHRSKSPLFGKMPIATEWFLETAGLNVFIAVVGITSGPGFVDGFRQYGLSLFLAGACVTLLPLVVMTVLARYVFKFDPVITLGVLCGARSATAAVGATREAAHSSVPMLGYSVPYAMANIVLTIGGAIIVAAMA